MRPKGLFSDPQVRQEGHDAETGRAEGQFAQTLHGVAEQDRVAAELVDQQALHLASRT